MTRLLTALLYAGLALVLTAPLSLHPASRVPWIDVDTDLYLWTLAWDAHAFLTRPLDIFDANIYAPARLTLAYSENLIGSALISAPIAWITGNPVLAMNVVTLLSTALCGLGAHVLARSIGLSRGAAVIAGLIFAFAPPRFMRIGQMHLVAIQWMPFALAFLHQYFNHARPRDLRLAVAFFSLQALTSGHGAVFTALAIGGLVIYHLLRGEPVAPLRRIKDVGVTGALALVPALLIALPYATVQQDIGLRRGLDEYPPANFGSFLASPTSIHAFILGLFPGAQVNETAMTFLFPGYVPLALAIVALVPDVVSAFRRTSRHSALHLLEFLIVAGTVLAVYGTWAGSIRVRAGDWVLLSMRSPMRAWVVVAALVVARLVLAKWIPIDPTGVVRQWRDRLRAGAAASRRGEVPFYASVLLVGTWLSAPPPIGLWPFVYWLPGFNFIRVPSRFGLLALLGLAMVAAAGFDRLMRSRATATGTRLAIVVSLLLVAEFWAVPLPTATYAVEIPELDRWLLNRPKPFTVAEVPVPPVEETGFDRRHALFMLHSMAHWQKTVHGYSGYRPPLHTELYESLRRFPDEDSLRRLEDLDVDYLVVHRDLYPRGMWPEMEERLLALAPRLRLVFENPEGQIYAFSGSSRTGSR